MRPRTQPISDLDTYEGRFVTPQQLADYVRISKRTIYYHIAKGALPVVHIGNLVRIRIEDARRYIAA